VCVEGEEDKLLSERKKFRNIEKITSALRDSSSVLNGNDNSVAANLNRSRQLLGSVSSFDSEISELEERLQSAKIEVQDITESLNSILNKIEFDDFSAEKIEKRLETVRTIIKKYGGTVESAINFLEEAEKEFDMLSNAADTVDDLERKLKIYGEKLQVSASKLTKLRKRYANSFENAIKAELSDLGMGGSTFSVSFAEVEDCVDNIGANGIDSVEFLISPNMGEPLKPLAKIISGGEMSRFMLALKNIIAKLDNISTMVFDEIDTGISGRIAQVVAEKLYNISVNRQVLAVTHLPQLASMSDRHLLISKTVENGKTNTHLTPLDEEADIKEIARLIGGSDYSGHALPHAKEMKDFSLKYKTKIKN
jgi:DNA repair protein RecN (Recombination protein N)